MKEVIIGNRVPYQYFRTTGFGESDIAVHAGSYHLALKAAGIERANIMTYSSILPTGVEEVEQPDDYIHGEVMECIMASCTATKGEYAFAGIITGMLYEKESGKMFGGLVCENSLATKHIKDVAGMVKTLEASLDELYRNGFDNKYDLREIKYLTTYKQVAKQFGTAVCALCFISYKVPIY